MFCVIQMLSLTELAAGSSVSTFTAFAITSVLLLALDPPLSPEPEPPQPAAATRHAITARSRATRARPGVASDVDDVACSTMGDPFVANSRTHPGPMEMYERAEKITSGRRCNSAELVDLRPSTRGRVYACRGSSLKACEAADAPLC